jgi:multiple sugar transport system permease protein
MQKNIREVLIHVLTILFLLGVIFPLFWMFLCSIKPAGIVFALPPVWKFVPTIDNYRAALVDRAIDGGQFIKGLGTSPLPRYFFNSIIVAIAVTLSNLFVGGLAGYGMARYKVGGNVLPLAFLFGRMMPPIVFLFPFFLIAKNL